LNVIELRLPPLRERLDDIGLLSTAILARLAGPDINANLAPAALQALQAYTFPGNVRELENILERALAFANDGVIEVADLALKPVACLAEPVGANGTAAAVVPAVADVSPAPAFVPVPIPEALPLQDDEPSKIVSATTAELPSSLPEHLDDVEREIIQRALAKTQFNRTQAAELLGISFRQLRYRMQRLSIHEPEA
jgi:two-component system, NtrC family, response regulator PilR